MKVLAIVLTALVASSYASYSQLWEKMIHEPSDATDNIPALAQKLGLTTLVQFVTKAGLAAALSAPGNFTVFAPTNDAFASLPPAVTTALENNVTLLKEVLEYHVLGIRAYSGGLTNEELVPTLLPGFEERINTYKGRTIITVDGRQVIQADQNATNGVIHVLSGVIIPPPGTVVALVEDLKNDFSTLLTAVSTASLTNTLNGPGPFTVFAPTNAAFAKLPPGELAKLLANPAELKKVLLYHVLSGTVYSAGLSDGLSVPTLNGQSITINISGSTVTINNGAATVIEADVSVTNGAVHVIDSVLIPPSNFHPDSVQMRVIGESFLKYRPT